MTERRANSSNLLNKVPGHIYLWLAIIIFGASNAITRGLTEIGSQKFIDGRNPISFCNVLFVGNLCALLVLILIYRRQLNIQSIKQLSNKDWFTLIVVAILSGAIAPGLTFEALSYTMVTNVILIGRIEPPLVLALSVCRNCGSLFNIGRSANFSPIHGRQCCYRGYHLEPNWDSAQEFMQHFHG